MHKGLVDDSSFTFDEQHDTIFPDTSYKSWEEIPVSKLTFNSNTSQICFIALDKDAAIDAINLQAIPKNTVAYEYMDEVPKRDGKVILAVEIDTANMLDMTHRPDYIKYMRGRIDKNKGLIKDVSIIRRVTIDMDINQYKIVYIVLNNSSIKKVDKVR